MSVILLVEDNPHIMKINAQALAMHDYRTLQADSIKKCTEILLHNDVDLIVLDVMLPDGNGVELCRELKMKYNVPILFLSALGENEDMIAGLRAGGDDYMSKPYDIELLIARIEARLRERASDKRIIVYGKLKLNTVSMCGYVCGKDMLFTQKEFSVLLYLAKHAEQIVDRDDLYREVWGADAGNDKRALYTAISRVRKKLNIVDSDVTVSVQRKEGYILEKCNRISSK